MSSIVWQRDTQEAFENPYEYGAQDQFRREASILLNNLYKILNSNLKQYKLDDTSVEKAVWLLQVDALDGLFDALEAIEFKRHRVASQLFRGVMEALDLAALFASRSSKSMGLLTKWYNNEVILHREYRKHIEASKGAKAKEERAKLYKALSQFTHRTYRAILDGYVRGAGDRLMHDRSGLTIGLTGSESEGPDVALVLPATMSAYHAVLAQLIIFFAGEIVARGNLPVLDVTKAFTESLEDHTVPRRFMPRRRSR